MTESSVVAAGSRRIPMVVGVVFALGWPLVLALFFPKGDLSNIRQDLAVVIAEWVAVAVLFLIVTRWERVAFFATVGLGVPKARDWYIVAFFALLAIGATVFFAATHPSMQAKSSILGQAILVPFALRALLVFTAGVCEEICFRGFAIERLNALTGNIWIAAVVGTALFTLGHVPRYGWSSGLGSVSVIGAALSLLYIWRRNLASCIALHWLIDGVSLLIVPAFATLR